jgi:hypothetical protein
MNHAQQQDIDDLTVFQEFTDSEDGPGIRWDSVEHAREPAPDIVCRSGSTLAYFELTQIDPKALHELVAWNQSDRDDFLTNRYGLTEKELAVFRAKYQGYALDLGTPADCIQPRGAVWRAFKYLAKHDPQCDFPQGPNGDIPVLYDDIAPDGELDMSIHGLHGNCDYMSICTLRNICLTPLPGVTDPIIVHGAVTSRNAAIPTISRKCERNRYRDESGLHPPRAECFHLLLWTDLDPSSFLGETSEYLDSAEGRAKWEPIFGSVWLFDRVHQRVACHAFDREDSD